MIYEPYGAAQPSAFAAAKAERRRIRRLSLYGGSAILLYVALQNLLALPLALPGIRERYNNDPLLQDGADLLIMMICMLVPFLLLSRSMARVSLCRTPLPLERPRPTGAFLLAVPAGLAFCMAANYVTAWLISWIEHLGFELTSPDLPMATGALGVSVAFFRVVVMPAIVEEICFRGVMMQHLRRFGDWFAILMAALGFGLLHCNLIQAPFAFIVGIALGYFVIQTGSLWTSILIHGLNNLLSLVFSYLAQAMPTEELNALYLLTETALFTCGAVCFLGYLLLQRRRARLPKIVTANTFPQKLGAYLTSPTMLLAIALMLYFTTQFVQKAGS